MAKPDLTLALITDIHHGEDRGTKMGSAALGLLKEFGAFVADLKPDCIVEMGDRISDAGRKGDMKLMQDVAESIRRIPGEWHHLLGNHDIAKLTPQENEAIMGCSFNSHSIDKNGVHLVLWNLNPVLHDGIGIPFDRQNLSWLKDDLAKTDLPTIIFTHVPLDNGSMKGNFYFENMTRFWVLIQQKTAKQSGMLSNKAVR